MVKSQELDGFCIFGSQACYLVCFLKRKTNSSSSSSSSASEAPTSLAHQQLGIYYTNLSYVRMMLLLPLRAMVNAEKIQYRSRVCCSLNSSRVNLKAYFPSHSQADWLAHLPSGGALDDIVTQRE